MYGAATRRKGGECFCMAGLRGGIELQRFKNEEGRREEGDKGQARMIPGEGGRGPGMRGGAANCSPTRRYPGELLE
jgi:hypothetical protein